MADQAPHVFFRITRSPTPALRDFTPQKAQGTPQPNTEDTEILFSWEYGVSVMNTQQQALNKAKRFRGRLGRYVVGVRVEEDGPVRYLKTLGRGHFDLIGGAADMLARVQLPAEDALADE